MIVCLAGPQNSNFSVVHSANLFKCLVGPFLPPMEVVPSRRGTAQIAVEIEEEEEAICVQKALGASLSLLHVMRQKQKPSRRPEAEGWRDHSVRYVSPSSMPKSSSPSHLDATVLSRSAGFQALRVCLEEILTLPMALEREREGLVATERAFVDGMGPFAAPEGVNKSGKDTKVSLWDDEDSL